MQIIGLIAELHLGAGAWAEQQCASPQRVLEQGRVAASTKIQHRVDDVPLHHETVIAVAELELGGQQGQAFETHRRHPLGAAWIGKEWPSRTQLNHVVTGAGAQLAVLQAHSPKLPRFRPGFCQRRRWIQADGTADLNAVMAGLQLQGAANQSAVP